MGQISPSSQLQYNTLGFGQQDALSGGTPALTTPGAAPTEHPLVQIIKMLFSHFGHGAQPAPAAGAAPAPKGAAYGSQDTPSAGSTVETTSKTPDDPAPAKKPAAGGGSMKSPLDAMLQPQPMLGPLAMAAKDKLEAQRFEHEYQLNHISHFQQLQQIAAQKRQETSDRAAANNARTAAERAKAMGPRAPGQMTVGTGADARTFSEGQEGGAAAYNNYLDERRLPPTQNPVPRGAKAQQFQDAYYDSQRDPNLAKRGTISRFRPKTPLTRPLSKEEQAAYELLD